MVIAKRAINNSYVMRFVSGLARTHAIQRIDCINTRISNTKDLLQLTETDDQKFNCYATIVNCYFMLVL